MEIIEPLNFFILVIVTVANATLAFFVYKERPTHATNRIFSFLTALMSAWLIAMFFSLQELPENQALFAIRATFAFAIPLNFLFFLFAYTIPSAHVEISARKLRIFLAFVFILMVTMFSPHVIQGVKYSGSVYSPIVAPGILLFQIFILCTNVATFYYLWKKYQKAEERSKKTRLILVGGGIFTMLALMYATVVIPATFLSITTFVPFFPLYTLFFMAPAAYAIVRYEMFNLRIIATQALVVVIWVILFAELFFAETIPQFFLGTLVFILVLFFGILLIRSSIREVKMRKELVVANKKLKELDQRKSEFISLASHQLRSPLSVVKGYSSMLLDDSFGALSKDVHDVVDKIFRSSKRLLGVVEDFLTISRIEQNRLKYDFQSIDLKKLTMDIVNDLEVQAQEKGISLNFVAEEGKSFKATADVGKITQVIGNLIDNSIKYTQQGHIKVNLSYNEEKNTILLSIKDTGIGMSQETLERLFQKFSRAKDAHKTNVSGTGLGLYVALRIVEAHHGRVWAESEGEGKGSIFFIELLSEE